MNEFVDLVWQKVGVLQENPFEDLYAHLQIPCANSKLYTCLKHCLVDIFRFYMNFSGAYPFCMEKTHCSSYFFPCLVLLWSTNFVL